MKTIEELKLAISKKNPTPDEEAGFFFEIIGDDLYTKQSINLNYSEFKDNIVTIWKDLARKSIYLNGKDKEDFFLWIDWLVNLEESSIHLLSEDDKNARELILANLENHSTVFPFTDFNLGEKEIELFNYFLKRVFEAQYFTFVSLFTQGPGCVARPYWMQCLAKLELLSPDNGVNSAYCVNDRLLGVSLPVNYSTVTLPTYGKTEFSKNRGLRILNPGGPASIYETFLNPSENDQNTPEQFFEEKIVASVENEQKTSKQKFLELSEDLNDTITVLKPNSNIILFSKHLNEIKDLPSVYLTSLNEFLSELLESLNNPNNNPDKTEYIQKNLEDFFVQLMIHKQKQLNEHFKESKISSSDKLFKKFGIINFAYLDKIIKKPHGKHTAILDLMDRMIKVDFTNKSDLNTKFDGFIKELQNVNRKLNKESRTLRVNFNRSCAQLISAWDNKKTNHVHDSMIPAMNEIRLLMQEIEKIKTLPGLPLEKATIWIKEFTNYLQKNEFIDPKIVREGVQFFINSLYNDKLERIVYYFLENPAIKIIKNKRSNKVVKKFKELTLILDRLFHMPEAKHYNLINILADIEDKLRIDSNFLFQYSPLLKTETDPGKISENVEDNKFHWFTKEGDDPDGTEDKYAFYYRKNGKIHNGEISKNEAPSTEAFYQQFYNNKYVDEETLHKLRIEKSRSVPLDIYLSNTVQKLQGIEALILNGRMMEQYKPLHQILLDHSHEFKEKIDEYKYLGQLESTFSKKDPEKYIKVVENILLSKETPALLKEQVYRKINKLYPNTSARPEYITKLLYTRPKETENRSFFAFFQKEKLRKTSPLIDKCQQAVI